MKDLKKETSKKTIPYPVLLMLMILTQNTHFFSGSTVGMIRYVRDFFLVLIWGYLSINVFRRHYVNAKTFAALMVLLGSIIVSMVLNWDFSGIYIILTGLIAFMVVSQYDESIIVVRFEQVEFIMALFYTSCWGIATLIPGAIDSWLYAIPARLGIFAHVHRLWLEDYINGGTPFRAFGIYREPGVYELFLICALIINFLGNRKNKIFRTVVYIVAVISTKSSTGYLCLPIAVIIGAWANIRSSPKTVRCIGIGALACIPFLPYFYRVATLKFQVSNGIWNHSLASRFSSILVSLYVFALNPLFGKGQSFTISNMNRISQEVFGISSGWMIIADNTNTILAHFAMFGIICGTILTVGSWRAIMRMSNMRYVNYAISLLLLLLYAGEDLMSTVFPYALCFIGFCSEKKMELTRNSSKLRGSSV